MKTVALMVTLGLGIAGETLAACPVSPAIFAKVTVRSCESVTFRSSSARVNSGERSYFAHPPGAEYTATLLSVRVESSERRWPMPAPQPYQSSESWPIGSFMTLVMDGPVDIVCGDQLPRTIEVATTSNCCDTIPSSGGQCLVPPELTRVRPPPKDEKWYRESK
jgi:hypothetical protein